MDWTPETIEVVKTFVLKTDEISQKIFRIVEPFLTNHGAAALKFVNALTHYYEMTPNQDTSEFIDVVIDDWNAKAASEIRLRNQTESILKLWPGWRLQSFGFAKRIISSVDWRNRWTEAGNACKWNGASKSDFIALKKSPIWTYLGKGAGGYSDTYGLPYPPFIIGSDMDWRDATVAECEYAGIKIKMTARPLNRGEQDIYKALCKFGMPKF
ncbi:MAG: hypothetical protein J6V72_20675 [Kiritimatiellae bacterium]|nr:hypothetical protein [Kiritimatiellia bacterium]